MESLDEIDKLPSVEEALRLPYEDYKRYASGILNYKQYCQFGLAESIEKVFDWCQHLNCTTLDDPCTLLSKNDYSYTNLLNSSFTKVEISSYDNQSTANPVLNTVYGFMLTIGYNMSSCYDDYLCDADKNNLIYHWLLGLLSFIICLYGIISNLVLLPAYNFGLNRSGATVYLTAMALFDCIFLCSTILIDVSHYMPSTYEAQMEVYGQFVSYLIPVGQPLMQLCELLVLWLTVALLTNRLNYLNYGEHAKLLCSQFESIRVITAIVLLCVAYFGCKFLEYACEEYTISVANDTKVARVMLTRFAKSEIFQNIFYHWFKVPLEMFLPYLGCGVLISAVVSNMINLHNSKWKAVASLCNDTACACVCRAGICGTECSEGVRKEYTSCEKIECQPQHQSTSVLENLSRGPIQNCSPNLDVTIQRDPTYLDPIEQELAYLFFQQPQIDETRENANVITAVCIGLILLLCKLPKFFLHIISTENYIAYDASLFIVVNHFLDTLFAALKPTVCILVGAHFRRALLSPREYCSKSNQTTTAAVPCDSIVSQYHAKSVGHPVTGQAQQHGEESTERSTFIQMTTLKQLVVS